MLEPGHIFASRYRIRRCIAEGGMAAIFEAEHLGTERRVALKLLFPHIISVGNTRQKFELEAKISARVNSPYIVQVLDAGVDPETRSPFLAMELLEGETLTQRIATRGPMSLEQALPFLEQLAAGLDAAHGYRDPGGAASPIVHRDLKPDNVFLSRAPGGAVSAKILDYGIAKVLDGRLQISQELQGTPLFMAAEQITGGSLSPRTDIWAYGLIAHYMLTGEHYWRTSWRDDANVQALFAEILTLPLDAPSVRWRELSLVSTPPPAFDGWLLRCIDRDPAQRFPGAGAAFEALLTTLGGAAPSLAMKRQSAAPGSVAAAAGGGSSGASIDGASSVALGSASGAVIDGASGAVIDSASGAVIDSASGAASDARSLAPASGEPTAALAAPSRASSTGSIPALVTTQHRISLAKLAARLQPSRSLAAAAAVTAVAAAGLTWLIGSSGAPAPRAARVAPALEGASASLPPPSAGEPVRVPEPPSVEPAAAASTAASAAPAKATPAPEVAAPEVAAPAVTAPSVRIAPVPSTDEDASVTTPGKLPARAHSSGSARSGAAPSATPPSKGKPRRTSAASDAYRMR